MLHQNGSASLFQKGGQQRLRNAWGEYSQIAVAVEGWSTVGYLAISVCCTSASAWLKAVYKNLYHLSKAAIKQEESG